jgi:dTDP-4-dehydrorhamnose 3,5-epimerase
MTPRLIQLRRRGDERGWFCEIYSARRYAELGAGETFVQDNHSFSREAGVLRGLHFQRPPHAQAKLVRCVRGAIWDVAVDIRRGSPSYGRFVACELSAENALQLYVPIGFAHGFLSLQPGAEVEYKSSDYYAPSFEDGVAWNDPDLALPWPLGGAEPKVSARDQRLPRLAALDSPFGYAGEPLRPLQAD